MNRNYVKTLKDSDDIHKKLTKIPSKDTTVFKKKNRMPNLQPEVFVRTGEEDLSLQGVDTTSLNDKILPKVIAKRDVSKGSRQPPAINALPLNAKPLGESGLLTM